MRELDREVAEKVMGLTVWVEQRGASEYVIASPEGPWLKIQNGESHRHRYAVLDGPINPRKHIVTRSLREYSTSIADAWLVVEAMREKGWPDCRIFTSAALMMGENNANECCVGFYVEGPETKEKQDSFALAATVPEAICRAALKAVTA